MALRLDRLSKSISSAWNNPAIFGVPYGYVFLAYLIYSLGPISTAHLWESFLGNRSDDMILGIFWLIFPFATAFLARTAHLRVRKNGGRGKFFSKTFLIVAAFSVIVSAIAIDGHLKGFEAAFYQYFLLSPLLLAWLLFALVASCFLIAPIQRHS